MINKDIANILEEIFDSEKTNSEFQKLDVGYINKINFYVEVIGLEKAQYQEVVKFENGEMGIVLEISEYSLKVLPINTCRLLKAGMRVFKTDKALSVPVGMPLLDKVINPLGMVLNTENEYMLTAEHKDIFEHPIEQPAKNIMDRKSVHKPIYTGVMAIDLTLPIGCGQRQLICGDRRTGKTTIAINMILNQKSRYLIGDPVYCVYVGIGQSKADIKRQYEFLKEHGATAYTTFIAAFPNESSVMRYIAPYAGTTIAEYFRELGHDVLIVYDDLSKHAIACREISLLLGRSAGREAYPGDIFYIHSRLLERAACLKNGSSLTALPIIETQAGDISAYIPTNVISITDGQLFLNTQLFLRGQKPAIDISKSVSRIGSATQVKAVKQVAGMLKIQLSRYEAIKSFAQFLSEVDSETQQILERGANILELLKQNIHELYAMEEQVVLQYIAMHDGFAKVKDMHKSKALTLNYIKKNYAELLTDIKIQQKISDSNKEILETIISDVKNFTYDGVE